MKSTIQLLVLGLIATVSLSSTMALAESAQEIRLCGELTTQEYGPKCAPGEMCPQWRKIGYELERSHLTTKSEAVLAQMADFKDKDVCALGIMSDDGFDVEEIELSDNE